MSPRARLAFARRIAPWLIALAPLGCGTDDGVRESSEQPVAEPAEQPAAEPVEERVVVKVSFDETAYVDATLPTGKIVERVRHQTQSLFPALRKAEMTPLMAQQIDLPLDRLKRETVTVVDPATGATRSALRVHFHYATLAQLPKGHVPIDRLGLGVLHIADGPQTEAILTACTANGEKERLAATELWTVFDASLPSCVLAMGREHATIEVARRKLLHPEREIVPLELERTYLPVVVRVRGWGPGGVKEATADSPASTVPTPRDHLDVKVHAPAVAGVPGAPGAPGAAGEGNTDPLAMWDSKDREKDYEVDREDEAELRRASRSFSLGGTAAPPTGEYYGSYKFLAPNYALLYVVIIAGIVLLVGKSRQQSRR